MKRQSGFSFVELMVVSVILGILVASGYPLMMNFASETKVEQEAWVLYHDICLVRDSTISAGIGTGTINFFCQNGVVPNPITSYELLGPNGFPIKPALMDIVDCPPSPVRYRRDIGSRAVCIEYPLPLFANDLPASTSPDIRTLHFDRNGLLTFPTTGSMSFLIRYYNSDSNTSNDSHGTWNIQILNDLANPATNSRVLIRKL